MAFKLIWSPSALLDLKDIAAYMSMIALSDGTVCTISDGESRDF